MGSDFAFLAAMTVWIPFLPGAAETQPLLAAVFVLLSIPLILSRPIPRDLLIGFACFVGALLIAFAVGVYTYGITAGLAAAKYLFGPIFLLTLFATRTSLPSRWLTKAVVWLHAGLLLLYGLGYGELMARIWPRYTYEGRFSFLAPEPSYAATYLFALYLGVAFGLAKPRERLLYGAIVISCMLATESLLALLYFCVIAAIHFRARWKRGVVVVSILLAAGAAADYFGGRIAVLQRSIRSVDVAAPLESFIALEPSATVRLLMNFTAIDLGLRTFVGHGLGSFDAAFGQTLQESHDSLIQVNPIIRDIYIFGAQSTPQSYLAGLVFEAGVLGVFGFMLFAWRATGKFVCSRFDSTSIAFLGVAAIFLFLQSQISNPLYWYVFYLFVLHRSANSRIVSGATRPILAPPSS